MRRSQSRGCRDGGTRRALRARLQQRQNQMETSQTRGARLRRPHPRWPCSTDATATTKHVPPASGRQLLGASLPRHSRATPTMLRCMLRCSSDAMYSSLTQQPGKGADGILWSLMNWTHACQVVSSSNGGERALHGGLPPTWRLHGRHFYGRPIRQGPISPAPRHTPSPMTAA